MSGLTLPTRGITWPSDDHDPELVCVICDGPAEARTETDFDDDHGECDVDKPEHPCGWCAEPMCAQCSLDSPDGCCSDECGENFTKDWNRRYGAKE